MRKHLGREEIMERKEIYASIEDAVHSIFGKERSVCSKQYVPGGDINEASVLTLDDGTRVFVKMNTPQSLPNFEAEAEGMEAIRLTGTIGVAKTLGTGRDEKSSFLLLEYISPGRQVKNFWEVFALELGAMHRKDIGDKYGFKQDNWIGSRKQKNTLCDSWIEFFRECRLRPQFEAAGHFFSVGERNRVEWLLEHLDRYLYPEKANGTTHVSAISKKEWLNQQERKESIMKKLITGTHHTAMRFNGEEKLNRALSLYTDVLGLDIIRKWGEGTGTGVMVNTGDSIIEMFADASEQRTDGVVEHIALATDDVDACVAAVRAAGCEITKEPCDIVIPSEPAFPARIAFFRGLGGEMIELFCEK